MFFHWGRLLTKWAPYIDFSHEYSPINYPILQVNHRIEHDRGLHVQHGIDVLAED